MDGDARWYREGLRFRCTACGNCCTNGGDRAYVYVMPADVRAIAAHLGVDEATFRRERCREEDGWTFLDAPGPACPFLGPDRRCQVYPVRPVQCRTWPFWDVHLARESWEREVLATCPGARDPDPSARLHGPDEVDAIAEATEAWYAGELERWDGPEPGEAARGRP